MTSVLRPSITALEMEHPAHRYRVLRQRVQERHGKNQASHLLNTLATARQCAVCWGMFVLMLSGLLLGRASGEELVLYGAGSLRGVMTQVAAEYQTTRGLQVRTDFGPSGLMRERIERGEKVDVFASADLGHPLTLQREGRAMVVAMFTRNTLCAVALPRVGLTTAKP